ncbi:MULTISPECIES: MaoC family dehydratase [Streptomyces]|uniref:MaoC family dehydratase n=1 Tax=Streptomyces TaxID=1883 RepID=UPI000AAF8EA2|nr:MULTISPECIES: MaoC family dehydratase [unclassified Streptomyces]MCX4802555.1 MaoC family dehydratase [Streptomyces sp. NBC_01214]WSR18001.1 MaoC family dehydratase [Streptomyces sp. NBC_01207]WTA21676.1 MaoC family dehydratase [Streptomyces sp. NBC_00853]
MAEPRVFTSAEELHAGIGEPLGPSEWLEVDQKRIDLFADATGDHQWIHVDPERAAGGPFGSTIAHGYLTLSLLPSLVPQIMRVEGMRMGLNYGTNKVRFPAPVPVGSRLRAVAVITEVAEAGGGVQVTATVTVEREGGDKPVCVAESVSRYYF